VGETQKMKKLSEKDPLHRIKGFPEIYFYEAPGRGSLPAIMHEELLGQVNVIDHIPPSKEIILNRTNNVFQGTTQSTG
jgi:hypothetical protein